MTRLITLIFFKIRTMSWELPIFGVGSTLGAVIDYLITLTGVQYFYLPPTWSLGLAMLVSSSVVFIFHEVLTFQKKKEGRIQRYRTFMISSAVIFFLRAVFLSIFLTVALNLSISLIVTIIIVFFINYLFSSRYIFRK